MNKLRLLVDADLLVYRFAFKAQTMFENTILTNKEAAITELTSFVQDLMRYFKVSKESVYMCLSNKYNFRRKVYPTYKANRPPRPVLYSFIRSYIRHHYKCLIMQGLEADDVLGIEGTRLPNESILCSIDKDLKQVPNCYLFNWDTGDLTKTSKEAAKYMYTLQMLTGDTTDNYGGVPSIGIKGAEALLDSCLPSEYTDMLLQVYKNYRRKIRKKYKMDYMSYMKIQHILVKILTYHDYLTKSYYKDF